MRKNISNHPLFSINREVEFISIVCTTQAIELRCKVHYEDNKIPSKEVILLADNTVIVDANGNFYVPKYNTVMKEGTYIDEITGEIKTGIIEQQELIEEPTFGQFDFLMQLKRLSINELIDYEITRADSLNRFD